MGKTDTIRQRRVDVWVPSLAQKEKWKEAATERKQSLSSMIIQVVEESVSGALASSEDVDALQKRILDLEAEVARRDERIQDITTLKERLEMALDKYRTQDFLQPEGMKVLDHRLISILAEAKDKSGRQRVVDEDEILRRMRVAVGSTEAQAVAVQLEALELHGVIKARQNGWCWHE